MNILKKGIITIVLVLFLMTGVVFWTDSHPILASSAIEYNFDDETELNDFSPFFIQEEAGTNGQLETFATRWTNSNSQIISSRTNAGSGSTGNIAMLTLNQYNFTNFEAVVIMNFVGDSSWGWGGLSFRQSGTGNGWRADGCLAFVQKEGFATLWGSEEFDDTTIEGNKPVTFSKSTPFALKVRVVGVDATVTVMNADQTVIYSSVNYTFKKPDSLTGGYISLVSIDNSHAFDRLTITPLDGSGNPTTATPVETVNSIDIPSATLSLKVGETDVLEPIISPQTMNASDLVWTSSDDSIGIVKNGCVSAIKEGSFTVTAHSTFSLDIAATVQVTVSDSLTDILRTDFIDDSAFDKLIANYVRTDSDILAGNESVNDHWMISDHQTVLRKNILQGAGSDENVASLVLDGKEFSGFEATLVYRNTDEEYGWIGLSSGITMSSKRFMDDGQGFFIQREGIATIWGKNIGGPFEKSIPHYDIGGWHILRVKAYGKEVQIFVDDLETPCFEKTLSTGIQSGELGLFTSGRATFEIASFTTHYLSSEGELIDIGSVTGLSIEDKISSAKIGDSYGLNVALLPADLDGYSYSVTSSDGNICFLNNGILRFIGAGTVTITVTSDFNPLITDSMTIEVLDTRSQTHDYYYVTTETPVDPDDDSKTGCQAGMIGLSSICFTGLAFLGLLCFRRKF